MGNGMGTSCLARLFAWDQVKGMDQAAPVVGGFNFVLNFDQEPAGFGRVWADIHTVNGDAPVSYTHLRAHETVLDCVCRLLLEKKKILAFDKGEWNFYERDESPRE